MSINNYKVSHSNYTLKKIHQIVQGGTIYERDYMTLVPQGRSSDDTFTYSEGNFKMVSRRNNNGKRRHYFGDWIENPCADTSADTYYWNLACLSGITEATEDRIFLKPNYNDILDFAYFGSLVKVVENTVKEIAHDFPGELYPTDRQITYADDNGDEQIITYGFTPSSQFTHWVNGTTHVFTEGSSFSTGDGVYDVNGKYIGRGTLVDGSSGNQLTVEGSDVKYTRGVVENTTSLYYVENPFEIDVIHPTEPRNKPENYNPMKLLSVSFDKYAFANSSDESVTYSAITSWSVSFTGKPCKDGDFVAKVVLGKSGGDVSLFAFFLGGEIILFADRSLSDNNITIRPYDWDNKRELRYTFYDEMSDFAKLLLNKRDESYYESPYTCFIETPQETDEGLKTNRVAYTWPSADNGYNLDVTSNIFKNYIDSLLDIAEFYDDGFSNNLWNRMTHDSIKNLDRTFTKTNSTDTDEDYAIGTSKIEGLIHIAGAMFDDIKRSIDNVGNVNNITYDQNNNTPDYFLSDVLQLGGWEVSNVLQGLAISGDTLENQDKQVNVDFMRYLKLNSKSILSKKGTRMAIEELLGLFGLKSYDFAKLEYNSRPQSVNEMLSPTRTAVLQAQAVTVNGGSYRYANLAPDMGTVVTVLGDDAVIFYEVEGSGTVYTAQSATTYTVQSEQENIWLARSGVTTLAASVSYKVHGVTFDTQPSASSAYDYTIDEYVSVANTTIAGDDVDNIIEYNSYKNIGDGLDENNSLYGLPCVMVEKNDTKYIVPWFTNLTELDGQPYFQMYGGWGKLKKKKFGTSYKDTGIASGDTLFGYNYNFYDESINYVGVVNNLNDLTDIQLSKLHNGDIYYVYDISNVDSYYPDDYTEEKQAYVSLPITVGAAQLLAAELRITSGQTITAQAGTSLFDKNIIQGQEVYQPLGSTYLCQSEVEYIYIGRPDNIGEGYVTYSLSYKIELSHYFYLPDKENCNFYGEYETGKYGWIGIPEEKINSANPLGIRVLYLESIIDSSVGNNPHVGYGQYDDGEEFLDYFRQIFKGAIENDMFSTDAYQCNSGELLEGITNAGFGLNEVVDNMKTWYFADYTTGINKLTPKENCSEYTSESDQQPYVGSANYDKVFDSDMSPYNFETHSSSILSSNKEFASLSVINTKKLAINFVGNYPKSNPQKFQTYFTSSILPYLKQVIPSTTIVQYNFG